MHIKRIKLNLKDLDKGNFKTITKEFYDLPESGSDKYARGIDENLVFRVRWQRLHFWLSCLSNYREEA